MKRLFRSVVAAVVCAFVLAPASWGRDNRFRSGHPTGDDLIFYATSSRGGTHLVLIIPKPLLGTYLPILLTIKVDSGESSSMPTRKPVANRTTAVRK
jgi:hypothetical protein